MSEDLQQVGERCRALLKGTKSVHLASVDVNGQPFASYAPFVASGSNIYILISELAEHCQNLQRRGAVSMLFVEDESLSSNVFARQRLSMQGVAVQVARDTDEAEVILSQMEQLLGKTVGLLRTLNDFCLFRLEPASARYIVGFGRAYNWCLERDVFEHVSAEVLKSGKG
ncbi:MAG: HugZ family protein [Pseudomonadales bacterium]